MDDDKLRPETAVERQGVGSKRIWSGLAAFVQDLFAINQNLKTLAEQNRELRSQVMDLQKQVYRLAGQLEQIDKRIEQSVELHVLRNRSNRKKN